MQPMVIFKECLEVSGSYKAIEPKQHTAFLVSCRLEVVLTASKLGGNCAHKRGILRGHPLCLRHPLIARPKSAEPIFLLVLPGEILTL